ncbi:hypothetical protein KDU71_17985 [Carboxylicivirga sediminis]|uniref:Uncharacterized protein n=1 Tax=Carboxylicivirga sediminis TaxID=2006564 RepID=A0A941IZM6_9BACT|nr:hypothetical protein [Carboxylicivirga sediminis]MBR8537464.1 hypothetical protein [Carboxylicivirga sediminis]
MNTMVLLAGVIAGLATLGHFTAGTKMYLKPFKACDLDVVPKNVILSVFHYVSVYQILSSLLLIMVGVNFENCMYDPTMVLNFIGMNYAFFALVQIIIALTSSVQGGLFKMFQWIFWVLIALFIFLR